MHPSIPTIGTYAIAPSAIPADALSLVQINRKAGAKPKGMGFAGVPGTQRGTLRRDSGPVAVLAVDGLLAQDEHPLAWVFGEVGTVPLAEAIRGAADDASIRAIVLRINSPGGSLSGMHDLAQAVRDAKARKPVYAIVCDAAQAVAYWLASLCSEIVATPTAIVGAVGVDLPPLVDVTERLKLDGVRVFSAKSGKHKGAGMLGEAVTPDIRAEYQRIADTLAAPMLEAVAQGRKTTLAAIKAMQGRSYCGSDAKAKGLVDRIVPSVVAYVDELQRPRPDTTQAAPATKAGRGGSFDVFAAHAPARDAVAPTAPPPDPVEEAIRAEMKRNGGLRTQAMGTVFTRNRSLHELWKRQEAARRAGQGTKGPATPPPGKVPTSLGVHSQVRSVALFHESWAKPMVSAPQAKVGRWKTP